MPFVIDLYILVQYSNRYEEAPFNTGAGGNSADYAWMLCIGAVLLSAFGAIFNLPFLGRSLSFMILYVWTRKNPDQSTSLFGMKVQAFYLPWALLAFNLLIGNDIFMSILGIVSGHIYYFLHYIAPSTYGWTVIKTPRFLLELFDVTPVAPPGRGVGAPVRPFGGHSWGTGNVLGAN